MKMPQHVYVKMNGTVEAKNGNEMLLVSSVNYSTFLVYESLHPL
jgi:hypothetical protein